MSSPNCILSEAEKEESFKQIVRGLGELLRPKEKLNVWQWAEKYRYVAKGVSAKTLEGPRLYNSADAPHQRKPQESFTDPSTQVTVLIMASQIGGKTEIFNNVLGYHMDHEPRSAVVMYPQLDAAEKYSKKKFTPMVEASPVLSDIIKPARTRDSGNTILTKDFRGGSVYFVGANSPASLRGASGAVLLGDEVDSNPPSAGEEGDPIELLWKRGESFPMVVKGLASTPTIKGMSRIWEWWELSDQEFWFVSCPKCGEFQKLMWKQVTWPKDQPERAELLCAACTAALNDEQRLAMYYGGEWRATAPFKGIRGFHLNWLYVPWPCQKGYRNRLHQMAEEYLRAVKGGERKLQVLVNTAFCELWEVATEAPDHKPLMERLEPYTPERLPDGVVVVFAAVDVQKDRLECETIGLGADDECWGIEFRKFYGDTEQDDVWLDLANHLSKIYRREDNAVLPITATAIDMRHKPHKVRTFVQRSGLPRVFAVYGVNSQTPILVTTRLNKHYRLRTYAVNSKLAKDIIYARIKVAGPEEGAPGGPRFMHFPEGQGYDEQYFLQLTAEVLKSKKVRGVLVQSYEKVRERNEALDIRVYYLAEVDILKPNLQSIERGLKAQEGVVKERKDYVLKPAEIPNPKPQTPIQKPGKPEQSGGKSQRAKIKIGGMGGFKGPGPGSWK